MSFLLNMNEDERDISCVQSEETKLVLIGAQQMLTTKTFKLEDRNIQFEFGRKYGIGPNF